MCTRSATSVSSSDLKGGKRASCSVDALAREGWVLPFFVCVLPFNFTCCVFVFPYACLNVFHLLWHLVCLLLVLYHAVTHAPVQ